MKTRPNHVPRSRPQTHTTPLPDSKVKKGKKLNKAWLHAHINDPYVKLAQKEGYRARAAYKLQEIDETFGLIRPGDGVVDLGCAPGAWSQYVRRKLLMASNEVTVSTPGRPKSKHAPPGGSEDTPVPSVGATIIGLDILPMEPIEGVLFIQGDFREPESLQKLEQALLTPQGPAKVDVVISDMAPNLSGIESADAARMAHLVELAIEFAQTHMKTEGALLVKLFHGRAYDALVQRFRDTFKVVKPFKPKASRPGSAEVFLLGRGLK